MQPDIDPLKLALSILTALSEYRQPDGADVIALRKLTPLKADSPIDEVACEVIKDEVRRRARTAEA